MPERWTVTPLIVGSSYSSSCTLIESAAHRVLVDTGLSLEERALRRALDAHRVAPEDVDLVVNTHLHLDHCGNNAIFPRAQVVLSRAEWRWTEAFYAAVFSAQLPERAAVEFYPELDAHDVKPRTIRSAVRMARLLWSRERLGDEHRFRWIEDFDLPAGLEWLPTPGHTPHHVSLRIAAPSPILIAGDAVLHEDPSLKVRTMIPYSRAQFEATRERLLRMGTAIIPGHGPSFLPQPALLA
jgi:N-acyl homoserine lactone hydrolase